ncbi:uncharacterized protein LOC144125243 [Amblyomma americanum]
MERALQVTTRGDDLDLLLRVPLEEHMTANDAQLSQFVMNTWVAFIRRGSETPTMNMRRPWPQFRKGAEVKVTVASDGLRLSSTWRSDIFEKLYLILFRLQKGSSVKPLYSI